MSEFRTKEERDAAARALMAPNQNQAQQAAPEDSSWSNWFSNRFSAENALNIPHNAYALTSNAIGSGINAARYFLDPETAPHPTQRQTDPAASRAAFDAASTLGAGASVGAGHAAGLKFASQASPVFRLGRNRSRYSARDMLEGLSYDPKGSFNEWYTSRYRHIKRNGRPIGSIAYHLPKKDEIYVDSIGLFPGKDSFSGLINPRKGRIDANKIGPKAVRAIYDELKSLHPSAKKMAGNRVSGAREKSGASGVRANVRIKR